MEPSDYQEAIAWLQSNRVDPDAVAEARRRNLRRRYVAMLALLVKAMVEQYGHIMVPLASWFDWERLRVNVTHLVAPELVKWR